jgi:thiol-disulfide isomerase/thioredoxin
MTDDVGTRLEPTADPQQLPRLPLGPGRAAYSKRTRTIFALTLGAVIGLVLVGGALLATDTKQPPLRSVTIPLADRGASAGLIRAAELVGFQPAGEPGAGQIESQPIAPGGTVSASNLLAPGSIGPGFSLRTPVGQRITLAALRGKTVLLEFFATWCRHCAAEAPHLKTLSATLAHARYAFLSVNADGETAPSVLAYHVYFGLPFPSLLDPSSRPGSFHSAGSRGPVSLAYKVPSFPTFYVLDPRGRVAWAASGEQPDALLLRELRAAGRESAA